MSAAGGNSAAGYACHCGKEFLRREHLRRHQATHRPPSFVCQLCQRSFTRNDMLRRHAASHAPKPGPESRAQQACAACHSNKTKCDGGSPCLLCAKRGIECLYRRQPHGGGLSQVDASVVVAAKGSFTRLSPALDQGPSNDQLGLVSPIDSRRDRILPTPGSPEGISSAAMAGMSSVLNALDTPGGSLRALLDRASGEPTAWSTACLDAYMDQFHPHWPVVHGPTFDLIKDPLQVTASVIMVGCWLKFPKIADELVIDVHKRLTTDIFRQLCDPDADFTRCRRNMPWKIEEYQAAVLNLVFAFYSKHESLLARARMLLPLFVEAVRQAGLFSSEVAVFQTEHYFPGTYLPFLLSNREKRTRLVSCLFKIDTYFSLLTGQSRHLQIEELDAQLPSSFAVWDSHGLDEFQRRYRHEPAARAGITLCNFVQRPELLELSAWFVDDVHVGLCAMVSAVWKYNATRRNGGLGEPDHKDQLTNQLKYWKIQLDRVLKLFDPVQTGAHNLNCSIRHYLGAETEESSPSTLARIRSLVLDAQMLYNIIGMYLYADVPLLGRFVRAAVAATTETPASSGNKIQGTHMRDWAFSSDDRRAVSFCLAAFKAYNHAMSQGEMQGRSAAPLTDVALSNGATALSVWFGNGEHTSAPETAAERSFLVGSDDWVKILAQSRAGL